MAREDVGLFIDRIHSLAQLVTAAARSPDAQADVSIVALGGTNEIIVEDIKRIEDILDRCLD